MSSSSNAGGARIRCVLLFACLTAVVLLMQAAPASAALEFHAVKRHLLDNGMTVLLLEDRNFPVVSVQMSYRVGARNETSGKTGLAHFLEHMAFRATERFPGTEVVSRIYAVGGEWHGYTWTDQTTYFATVPKAHWELLLEIEAERMSRLVIDPAVIEAERGAVLAEMHMYENDPSAMLIDTLAYSSFLVHPYRNNTIGLESDIASITRADVRNFYDEHYHPANAILAVVGDFHADRILKRVDTLFGGIEPGAATPLPHTAEPLQHGERRIVIRGHAPGRRFRIGYRAPGVNHTDYAAFLVLQEVLAGGSGVNFLQNDWGTPARDARMLYGTAAGITSWFPPSAQNYLFTIGGHLDDGESERDVERAIEAKIASLREQAPAADVVNEAVAAVIDELVYDVQTTEDAAHQLAYFEGLGALDVLLTLPERVRQVTAADISRVAATYLAPERRTLAWYRPFTGPVAQPAARPRTAEIARPADASIDDVPVAGPEFRRLGNGLPVIIMQSDFAPAVHLKIVAPGGQVDDSAFAAAEPEPGMLSWNGRSRPAEFAELAARAANALRKARSTRTPSPTAALDPETRLEQEFLALLAPSSPPAVNRPAVPAAIVVVGDVDVDDAFAALQAAFGRFGVASAVPDARTAIPAKGRKTVTLDAPVAQSRLGYAAQAPAPSAPDYLAWRILLYIFAHDYEGRFGKAAISDRGLAYYVDARYRSSGGPGWVTLSVGVDPHKVEALTALLATELARLETDPPTAIEVAEAKRHLIGRAVSAAQSNEELATKLARHYIQHGGLPSLVETAGRLNAVSVEDVAEAVPGFRNGVTIIVAPRAGLPANAVAPQQH